MTTPEQHAEVEKQKTIDVVRFWLRQDERRYHAGRAK